MSNVNDGQIWSKFNGKRTKRNYWVQTPTEEYFDDMIEHMVTGFVLDEPTCKYSGIVNCEKSIESLRQLYANILKEKYILLCLTNNDDDVNGKPVIAGMNMTTLSNRNDHDYNPVGKMWTNIYNLICYVSQKVNAYDKLNLDGYLTALGLYVAPDYRGDGIGLELLKAREPMCRAYGIGGSCTVFTSVVSQKLAERIGFKDFIIVSYEQLFKERPDLVIPNIQEHTKNCRFMYIEYK